MNQAIAEQQPQEDTPDPRERERLTEALKVIVGRLSTEAEDRVAKRSLVEKRWIDDLRQFQGEYEDEIKKELIAAKKSQLFINQTRSKSNACEARLSDMLFPTDDKNWGIKPTPVPELDQAARQAVKKTETMVAQANEALASQDPQGHALAQAAEEGPAAEAQRIKVEIDEARERCDAMSKEIEDQLTECQYAIEARDVITDACKVGTGIMKGPVASADRVRRSWSKVTDPASGASVYQLEQITDARPAFHRVDFWAFFPESDARKLGDSADTFERHIWTPKDLRNLARQPGFDKDAIRRVLTENKTRGLPLYLQELRGITGENQAKNEDRFIGWEYRGPLTAQEMLDVCNCMGRDDLAEAYAGEGEADPLQEINVVIWFCNGEILKFGVHHLDSGESVYSIYNLDKDEASIWGYGIPYMMRDSQSAMNAAWRMMMDNAGLASGPQLEIDQSVIEPANHDWTLEPRKVWLRKADAQVGKVGLQVYNIDSHQAETANIVAMCKQFMDDETAVSTIAQGEQGAHTTQTANGMALLMNAVNVVFRRMVKNFDDDMTVPNIRRLYDWNMQFSKKDYIKGDYEVDARGTSVLLVREIQSQNLMVLANMTAHPVLGMLLKGAAVLRKLSQSMMVPADEIILTDDEIKRAADNAKNEAPPEDPNLKLKKEIAQIQGNTALQVAQMNRDTEMFKLAQQMNMKIEDLRAMLAVEEMRTNSKERIFAGEVGAEAARDAQAVKTGVEPKGSGGYVS